MVIDTTYRTGNVGVSLSPSDTWWTASSTFRFIQAASTTLPPPDVDDDPQFRRGDCNDDDALNIADALCILNWLFGDNATPGCVAATNINGDASVNIADGVALLNFLFGGGLAPGAPFPDCGIGTLAVDDDIGCETEPAGCQ